MQQAGDLSRCLEGQSRGLHPPQARPGQGNVCQRRCCWVGLAERWCLLRHAEPCPVCSWPLGVGTVAIWSCKAWPCCLAMLSGFLHDELVQLVRLLVLSGDMCLPAVKLADQGLVLDNDRQAWHPERCHATCVHAASITAVELWKAPQLVSSAPLGQHGHHSEPHWQLPWAVQEQAEAQHWPMHTAMS